MRSWNLAVDAPLCLNLVADARLSSPDYANDQVWELSLKEGEPPSLALQTTYGLRAHSMRLFPRFLFDNLVITDPSKFYRQPQLARFFPGYLKVLFAPTSALECQAEYWAASSQVVAGRLTISNISQSSINLRCEWIGQLNPLGEGHAMIPANIQSFQTLQGRTGNLTPVFFMNNNPQPSGVPYPALGIEIEIQSGHSHEIHWALASLEELYNSFDLARITLARPWDAEIAFLERSLESQIVDIYTGDPNWDAALALSQKVAFGLFFPGNVNLPEFSFVQSRQPDQGYSPAGDGSDYAHLWNGQTLLDAYYLTSLILPGAPELAESLLKNYISTQDESGFIDWKVGLAGQRSHLLAQPLLASLAVLIDPYKTDHSWLKEIYSPLLRFFRVWLKPEHDRDGDGIPEWDHPLQTGFEDNPLYDRWHLEAQGVDISSIETPLLGSLLFKECQSLIRIAHQLGQENDIGWLQNSADKIRNAVETTWDIPSSTYRYRDYQTHNSHSKHFNSSFKGSGNYSIRHSFDPPQRLVVHLKLDKENTHPVNVILHGQSEDGDAIEEINTRRFFSHSGIARATTQTIFKRIYCIEVAGLNHSEQVFLNSINYSQADITGFLPLWAGIPSPQRAKAMIMKNLFPHFMQSFGMPFMQTGSHPPDPFSLACTSYPWNQLIGEGLMNYGYQQETTLLVSHLMPAIILSLRQHQTFHEFYNARTGQPLGEHNSLRGLAPIGLFLQSLGVQLIHKDSLLIHGNNFYSWPITVKYRGIAVTRHTKDTVVTFPAGQTISVTGPGPHRVSLS